jgi:hypothetical protein
MEITFWEHFAVCFYIPTIFALFVRVLAYQRKVSYLFFPENLFQQSKRFIVAMGPNGSPPTQVTASIQTNKLRGP